jgi:hypothetical protein
MILRSVGHRVNVFLMLAFVVGAFHCAVAQKAVLEAQF